MKDTMSVGSDSKELGALKPGVFVKTFGCQMNEYDSEKMLDIVSSTHAPVSEMANAELIIVNTCSVREKGEHKLFSLLGVIRELKQSSPNLIVGVGGCVAQQEGEQILKRSRTVDFVVGTHNISLIPSLVSAVKEGRGPQVAVDYREEWETLPDPIYSLSQGGKIEDLLAEEVKPGAPRALIAIQRGCNKQCAFCVVPTTRGPEVSRDPVEILREIKLKARLGSREVLLLGQTVNSYGRDLSPRYPFHDLIRRIADIDGVERIRFISPHPQEVKPEFIELYRDVPQLCPHIHLPLQSGSDRLLKLMNRNYRMERYLEIVERLREVRPGIAITTDFIVGFPTETEEDFQLSLDIVSRVRYSNAFCFQYSRRPNTKAFVDYSKEDEVADTVAHRRLLELQAAQEKISREIHESFRGKPVEVLVETKGGGSERQSQLLSYRGRIPENTPIEIFDCKVDIPLGRTVKVMVERVTGHGLGGQYLP